MRGLDIRGVKEAARGHWGAVLTALAPELRGALESHPRHVPCPRHPGSRDGFRLFSDFEDTGGGICNTCGTFADGFALLRWLHGWSFPQAVKAVAEQLGVDPNYPLDPILDDPTGYYDATANRLRIEAIWLETLPDDGLIATYLRSRGLSGHVPPSLRLHPCLPYYTREGDPAGRYPAMCAPVQNARGEMVSIHRTYLKADGTGKAEVEQPKKLVRAVYPGASRGASIRLAPVAAEVNVTEGIETGLAVQEHTGLATLAAISAGGLEAFDPPSGVRQIHIWGDNDISSAGQRSAARAYRALMARGYITNVVLPPASGRDWLDLLVK